MEASINFEICGIFYFVLYFLSKDLILVLFYLIFNIYFILWHFLNLFILTFVFLVSKVGGIGYGVTVRNHDSPQGCEIVHFEHKFS